MIASALLAAALVAQADPRGAAASAREVAPRAEWSGRVLGGPDGAPKRVFALRLSADAAGVPRAPSKEAIFAAARGPDAGAPAARDGSFRVPLEPGPHALFAFADVDGDGGWDPGAPEPFGWWAQALGDRYVPAEIGGAGVGRDVALRAPMPIPAGRVECEGGRLERIEGIPVLRLSGDARARGRAHGLLLAPQIVDFLRFYVVEDKFGSAAAYLDGFVPFLESRFAPPAEYLAECEAILAGMRESGHSLELPELGRPFALVDLFAINSYIESRAARSSCTQFAAWGSRTAGTDVAGGMITGRNMDGECDVRKTTVSHFVLFAVEPSEPGSRRFVSLMWPGFCGTLSGLNDAGFYVMENAGPTGPGPVVGGLVPVSWAMREALATFGGDATPERVLAHFASFANDAGGSCGPGCVMLFATPFAGQPQPAFVIEGDRFGSALRTAGEAEPRLSEALLCSNHFHAYGVSEPDGPRSNFGRAPSFSSLWRYEVGASTLAAWERTGRAIGTAEMRQLLQSVAHGTTEHAVITRPGALELDVALASLECEPWDAPHREWVRLDFARLFREPVRTAAREVPGAADGR